MIHRTDTFDTLRRLAQRYLEKDDIPWIPCPNCGARPLQIVVEVSERESDSEINEEWIPEQFSMILRCPTASGCLPITIIGLRQLDMDPEPDEVGSMTVRYTIKAIWPPLQLIDVTGTTPAVISNIAETASACLWMDPAATANKLRKIAELLFPGDGTHSLHQRIARSGVPTQTEELAQALRVLGNAGSHAGDDELTIDDVVTGAEMLSVLLQDQYPSQNPRVRVQTIAQTWVRDRAPSSDRPRTETAESPRQTGKDTSSP